MEQARIFEDLQNDHARHRMMLEELGRADDESGKRGTLFEALRKELQAHAAAEEESLYASMLACPDLREEARHSVAEHKEIDDFLGELMSIEIASDAWMTKFEEMRHRYLHHIDEEEEEMFPAAAETLSAKAEERIAETFEQRKPRELEAADKVLPGDERE